ncbi:MAG: biopolymer transport protein ExbD [Puniceicoccaceae bacterium 5H]|nr:MAG: biopolymer transport protein ExbD [Puniceicoccaceae bacterium 5H]
MSRKRHLNKGEDQTDINISPMIDMVFILLIFFIVTTVFVDERGVPIDKPTPSPQSQQDNDSEPVIFRINRAGTITYKNNEVTLTKAEDIVKEVLSESDVPVILQVQRGAKAGRMIQVMDVARQVKESVKITVSTVE